MTFLHASIELLEEDFSPFLLAKQQHHSPKGYDDKWYF